MNIVSVRSGIPCARRRRACRQYRFGARTGGANVFAGVLLLVNRDFFAGLDLGLISPGVRGPPLFVESRWGGTV